MPGLIGCEDSGHIVLPISHPKNKNQWSLVGDGVMTLVYTILARCVLKSLNKNNGFQPGWKLRNSVKDVNRRLWDGKNELSFQIQNLAEEWFNHNSNATKLSRVEINGSTSLLLLQGEVEGLPFSLGIRNSGTEPKISVSLRLSTGCKEKLSKDPLNLIEMLCEHLSRNM
jgi:phosphomannomutase